MKHNPKEYMIVAVPFHADAASHDELAQQVNEKLNVGYELYGPPFFSEEMMYQAMTKPNSLMGGAGSVPEIHC